MSKLVGYGRVSTELQDTQLQFDALTRAGCDEIHLEQGVSGTVAAANRPVFRKVLASLEPGDTLTVWRLDRLGRSLIDLEQTITALKDRGIGFKSVTESIDTTTAVGKMAFHIMGAFAEFERNLIAERTKAGLQAVRDRGQKLGPQFKLTETDARMAEKMIEQGMSPKKIAMQFGVGYHTLWRAIRRLHAEEAREAALDGPMFALTRDDDIHSAREEGPNSEEARDDKPIVPDAYKPTLPRHASVGDEGYDPLPLTTAVRDQMFDKLVNDTSMHAHYCDCKACMAKEEA